MQTRIALYPSNEFEFKNQGYGILADTLSAVTTEEAQSNGNIKHELTLVYPLGGRLADELRKPNLIRAPIDGSEDKYNYQVFEIYDYLDDDADGTITVYAQAIGYRVLRMPFDNGGYIKHSGTVQQVLSYAETLISGWPEWFMLRSDLTQTVEIDSQFENLGKFIDHLLALTDAQIEHKWNELWIRDRGEHLKPVLRDDKNTIGVTIKHDYDTIVNKIIPEYEVSGEEGESTKVVGAPILSANPFKYFEYWRGKTVQFKDQSETVDYFSKSGLDEPSLTADIKPNLVDVDFDSVQLFDYVRVKNYKLNFEKELRITSRTFDALACRVTDFKAGSIESNLTTSTTAQIESATSTANDALATADDSKKGVEKLDIIMAETKKKVEEVDQAVIDAARDTKLAVDQADLAVEKATTAAENAGFAKDAANLSVQSAAQAQKDVETATTNANQALNSAKTALTNAGDAIKTATDAKTTVTNLSTTVDSINGTLATLATNETVDKLSKTVTSQGTSITQNANAIALKADSTTVNTLAGSVQTLDSQLKFTNAALAAKITKSDVTSMLGGYATQTWTTSEIKAQADSINLSVEGVRQKVDGLQVGGRNYWLESKKFTSASAHGDGFVTTLETDGSLKIVVNEGNNNWYTNFAKAQWATHLNIAQNFNKGDPLIISLWLKGEAGQKPPDLYVSDLMPYIQAENAQDPITNAIYTRYDYKFSFKTGGVAIHIGWGKCVGTYNLGAIAAWKSNVGHDWTPAPEDMATTDWTKSQLKITESMITAGIQKVNVDLDGVKSTLQNQMTATENSLKTTITKVDENATNYSSLEQKLNGFQTTVEDKADKSQLTQLSDQITSKMEQIGAPNLVPETFAKENETGTLTQVTHPYYQGSRILYQISNSTTAEATAKSKRFSLKPNTTYTLSFQAFASSNVSSSDVWVISAGADGSSSNNILAVEKKIFSPGHSEYTKVQITTGPNDRSAYVRFDNNGSTDGASSDLLFTEVQLEEGTIATPYRTAEAQVSSQITQLTDDINLRVQKGDVINQINISPESVLIAGKKVHITGETNIDNAVIKSAMIESISADKLSFGTATGISLSAPYIEGGTIVASKVRGDLNIASNGGTYSTVISSAYGLSITGSGTPGSRLSGNGLTTGYGSFNSVNADGLALTGSLTIGATTIRYEPNGYKGSGLYVNSGHGDQYLG